MKHLDKKIRAFVKLGKYLRRDNIDFELSELIVKTENNNKWFIFKNTLKALRIWGDTLRKENILEWLSKYDFENKDVKIIGVIMAGNIPLVGFHDLMCVIFTNHIAIVKTSSSDPFLIPFLYMKLTEFEPHLEKKVIFKEKIDFADAIIATGNNLTINNIRLKFNSHPAILRGSRNSIGILDGSESLKELKLLSNDIFDYFGFGCRSITKIYVPNNYNFSPLIEILREKSKSISLNEYINNFKKNKAINKIIKSNFHIAGKLVLIEDKSIHADISTINYEFYDNKKTLFKEINSNLSRIQCLIGNMDGDSFVKFGQAQKPKLVNYADNIDTIQFLLSL